MSARGPRRGALIAVDGIDAAAVLDTATRALEKAPHGGISRWDASGVFEDLAVAGSDAGAPSARTLLLLYAADLAFRVRWQIRPAMAEGRTVVAAPYVDTAMAFGRAAGLPAAWLVNLFRFAPRPSQRRYVCGAGGGIANGFVTFACHRMGGPGSRRQRQRLIAAAAAQLRRSRRRWSRAQITG